MKDENQYYKPNFMKRGWTKVTNLFKSAPGKEFDAVAGAIGFFVILVAFLEYKVFETVYSSTRDLILALSVLAVTGGGGVYAEAVLRRNKEGTDDQFIFADTIFIMSLIVSAIAGFAIWAQKTGTNRLDFGGGFIVSLPDFSSFVFIMITLVTVADILLLRAYFRGDVNAIHARRIAQSKSKEREANLKVESDLLEFKAEVHKTTRRTLIIEEERVKIRKELNTTYNGKVPENVLSTAMQTLDDIMAVSMPMNMLQSASKKEEKEVVVPRPN